MSREVYIVAAVRTPIGSFGGALKTYTATQLGATAIKGALDKIQLDANLVDEVYMGSVIQAGLGQAPARQAAKIAGLPDKVICTTINKVCASGMKSIALAAQNILLGDADIVVAGGMENMSSVPHYMDKSRTGQKLGDMKLIDGLVKDGLTDVYGRVHMGVCAETCAKDMEFSREEQDSFAIESYNRSSQSWKDGKFANEIVPVEVPQRRGDALIISEDEEYKKVMLEKIPNLRPVFSKEGTITAANASTINDGASALILANEEKAKKGKPLARIVSYGFGGVDPDEMGMGPVPASKMALKKAGLEVSDLDLVESNEAFAAQACAVNKQLGLNPEKVNVNGGAIALGHPVGATGAIIMTKLIYELRKRKGKYGLATMCIGGGQGISVIIEAI